MGLQVEGLYLRWNLIKKIENLDTLVTLTELELYDNQITIIENLDALVNLECVSLILFCCNEFKSLIFYLVFFLSIGIEINSFFKVARPLLQPDQEDRGIWHADQTEKAFPGVKQNNQNWEPVTPQRPGDARVGGQQNPGKHQS